MTYSFSRVNTFLNCPHAFKQSYLEGEEQWQNGWGVGGAWSHEVVERVLKGEVHYADASKVWEDGLPPLEFPYMKEAYVQKYVEGSRRFFENFKGISGNILAVERHFEIDIDGISFQGFTDLECRTKEGVNQIVDWKFASESGFSGKKLKEKARQLYLYSIAFEQHYNEYPKELFFYLCLYNRPIKLTFDKKAMEEAKDWLKRGVELIESAVEYPKQPQSFFCANLCGVTSCEHNGQHHKHQQQ